MGKTARKLGGLKWRYPWLVCVCACVHMCVHRAGVGADLTQEKPQELASASQVQPQRSDAGKEPILAAKIDAEFEKSYWQILALDHAWHSTRKVLLFLAF